MSKRLLLFLTLCLLIASMASADPVSRKQALAKAKSFMAAKGASINAKAPAYQPAKAGSKSEKQASYYVFNADNSRGFVIISGDDATPAVLGYSDQGSFDANNMPDNMRAWLEGYEKELAYIAQHPADAVKANAKASTTVRQPIAPLVKTHWDQSEPYNNLCPVISGSDRAVTGCVATSIAQVLYYNRYPAQTIADIPAYSNVSAIPSGTTFDWDNMLLDYGTATGSITGTDEQKSAVAKLMQVCGAMVKMSYGYQSAASSSVIPNALKTYLGYPSPRIEQRRNYQYADWENLIYQELASSRPVIYSGQSAGGGHSFVVDGFDGDQLFHINWGWGGTSDGYFLLSVVNPGAKGTGGGSSSDGYSSDQDAIVGVTPNSEATAKGAALSTEITGFSSGKQLGNVNIKISNFTGADGTFDFCLGYVAGDGTITPLPGANTLSETVQNNYSRWTFTLTATSIPEGVEKVYVISRLKGTSEWYIGTLNNWLDVLTADDGSLYYAQHESTVSLAASMAFGETRKAGSTATATVTITNSGTDEYYGDVYWYVSNSSTKPGSANTFTGITVLAGGTKTIDYSFMPSAEGTYYVWLTDANGNTLASGSVAIAAGEQSSQVYITGIEANGLDQATKREGTIQVGSATESGVILDAANLSGSALTINFGTTSPFTGKLTIKITSYAIKGSYTSTYSLDVSGFTGGPVDFTMSSWLSMGKYRIQLFNGTTQYGKSWYINIVDGGNCWIDGEKAYFTLVDNKYTIPEDATAADLTQMTTSTKLAKVVPNSNPNTVYYLKSNVTVPDALSGKNVVKGSTADAINIQDGYGFLAPIAFTATKATYTRTITSGISRTGNGGWTTLVLPFEASSVTADGKSLSWFAAAADTNKDFWLKKLSGVQGSTLSFDYAADKVEANMPYIIAVPDNTWGSDGDLTGKPLVFTGENVAFTGGTSGVVTTNEYAFRGYFSAATAAQRYALNAGGTMFVLGNNAAEPFRAYFEPRAMLTSLPPTLKIGKDEATGISKPVINSNGNPAIYNLQGQRVTDTSRKGIYIINGRKVVKR